MCYRGYYIICIKKQKTNQSLDCLLKRFRHHQMGFQGFEMKLVNLIVINH